jgi:hypothetical protein
MALLNGMSGKQPVPANPNDDLVDGGAEDNETMNGETPPDAEESTDGEEPVVLCTVLRNSDGTLSLVTGDEPDEMDGLAAPEGASPAEGGTPALPEGETFDNDPAGHGKLLKGILDLLRGPGNDGGDGGQADFDSGYNSKPQT